ncbi:MAG: hypothetical protein O3B13_16705 [Planctomycetota bacterium]|nr:hypothetical protein [Planctomycetota bacterium]MDA1164734.1 hypothetical protein [Planctomycetota bacterium]
MAKKKLGRWFAEYIERSAKYCRIGSILLVPGSLIVGFVTYWIVWVTLWAGIKPLLGLSYTAIDYLSLLIIVILFVWQFLRGSQFEETYRFAGESETGTISLNLARANGNGWVLLFDPGIAHAFVRVIALLYLTAPRMLGLALMLHHKAERLKRMDVPLCTRIIGRLVRAQGRVSFEDLARDFPEADLAQMIQPLADVDGVVFLDKKGPGMTLAPRFLEDFNEWTTRNSQAAEDFE